MSTQTLSKWEKFEFEFGEGGYITEIRSSPKNVIAQDFGVHFAKPWKRTKTKIGVDEAEITWALKDVEAMVRLTLDDTFAIRVTITNNGEDHASVPGAELRYRTFYPVTSLFAGATGLLAITTGVSSRPILGFVEKSGYAVEQDDTKFLTEPDLKLAPKASYKVSWQGKIYRSVSALHKELPAWWPSKVARELGDELDLHLPDSGIRVRKRVTMSTDEQGTHILGKRGGHIVNISDANGTHLLELWWAPDSQTTLRNRANKVLKADPRKVKDYQAALVLRAAQRMLIGRKESLEFLTTAVENSMARKHQLSIMEAGVVAWVAGEIDDKDLLDSVLVGWGEVEPDVGWLTSFNMIVSACKRLGMQSPKLKIPKTKNGPDFDSDILSCDLAGHLSQLRQGILGAETVMKGERLANLCFLLPDLNPARQAQLVSVVAELQDLLASTAPPGLPKAVAQMERRLASDRDQEVLAWMFW